MIHNGKLQSKSGYRTPGRVRLVCLAVCELEGPDQNRQIGSKKSIIKQLSLLSCLKENKVCLTNITFKALF